MQFDDYTVVDMDNNAFAVKYSDTLPLMVRIPGGNWIEVRPHGIEECIIRKLAEELWKSREENEELESNNNRLATEIGYV